MLRLLIRSSLVALLAGLAGAAAWWVVHDDPRIYERTVSFVLRPSEEVPDAQVPDAVRGLSQQDAQLVNTVAGVIGSDRFLRDALGLDADARLPAGVTISASVRPGSDIVETTLHSPDVQALPGLADTYADQASAWVDEVYRAYRLDLLDVEAPEAPVAPQVTQSVMLAALLGALLALGAVFAESRARAAALHRQSTEAGPEPAPSPDGDELLVEDWTAQSNGVEAILRGELAEGAELVKVGPGRFRIVPIWAVRTVRELMRTDT